jgi:tetratricopeptide (TPR) repeat protein
MRSVDLGWTPTTSSFITGYRIYRSDEGPGKGFKMVAETSSGTHRSYRDTQVEPGRSYYYRVTAMAGEGNESAMSPVARAVPKQYTTFPPSNRKAKADARSVTLTWSSNRESHHSHYVVYRVAGGKRYKLIETKETTYTDKGLIPHTIYSYGVTSVSTDGVESQMADMEATTKAVSGPPLDINVLRVQDVFSNAYKIYENEGIGKIRLTNNTGFAIPKIKVAFIMKEFMDFPSEQYVHNLGPGESREVHIKAVFNNRILDVTEDTPVQTEIRATYYNKQDLLTFTENHPIYVYEKHRMTWDEPGRIGTFVTTKDLAILEFARSVVTQYREADAPLVLAGMVFDAMGVMGMRYLPDPNNPYQETSGKTDFVDYIQYPRETLKRRSGDCDDLVGVYSAALESLGIETRIVLYTGHMLMMFSTGIDSSSPDGMEELYVVREGKLWVPVEVTLTGEPFLKAWEKGAKNYKKWFEGPGLYLLDLRKAWQRFKPASLRSTAWRAEYVSKDSIEAAYDEYRVLKKMSLSHRTRRYVTALKRDPGDVDAMHKLAIIYAQDGQPEEAFKLFEKAISLKPGDAALVNDVGNVYFLEGDYANACQFYEVATQFDSEDALIMVNLARCYMRLDKKEEARQAFSEAYRLQPDVSKRYRAMALDLLGEI